MAVPGAESLLTFHFECLQGMYFSEYTTVPDGMLLFSAQVSDPYYNFFCPRNPATANSIAHYNEYFDQHHRQKAVYRTPLAEPDHIEAHWNVWATDAWMTANIDEDLTPISPGNAVSINVISPDTRMRYLEVFTAAYSGDDPEDPYGQLAQGYIDALSDSFNHQVPAYKKYYVMAEHDETAVAVASLFTSNKLAGVYGVGTLPQYRGRGIGAAMMYYLALLAKSDGAAEIMLQTEAGSKVERWYEALGYKTRFTAAYYIETES